MPYLLVFWHEIFCLKKVLSLQKSFKSLKNCKLLKAFWQLKETFLELITRNEWRNAKTVPINWKFNTSDGKVALIKRQQRVRNNVGPLSWTSTAIKPEEKKLFSFQFCYLNCFCYLSRGGFFFEKKYEKKTRNFFRKTFSSSLTKLIENQTFSNSPGLRFPPPPIRVYVFMSL